MTISGPGTTAAPIAVSELKNLGGDDQGTASHDFVRILRHDLGILIHGTFILGLPGETKETIQETLNFAKEINPHTIQISLAAPYPDPGAPASAYKP